MLAAGTLSLSLVAATLTLLNTAFSLHGNSDLNQVVNGSSSAMINRRQNTAVSVELGIEDANVLAALANALDVLDLTVRFNVKLYSKVKVSAFAVKLVALDFGTRAQNKLNLLLTSNDANVPLLTLESHLKEIITDIGFISPVPTSHPGQSIGMIRLLFNIFILYYKN